MRVYGFFGLSYDRINKAYIQGIHSYISEIGGRGVVPSEYSNRKEVVCIEGLYDEELGESQIGNVNRFRKYNKRVLTLG